MADDRNRDSWRGRTRGSSIFSDDEGESRRGEQSGRDWNPEEKGWGPRWDRGGSGEAGRGGFFERARDEVRSWFGDEEEGEDRARGGGGGRGSYERSRYGEGQSGFGGATYRSNRSGGGGEPWGGGDREDRGGGRGGFGGGYPRREQSGTSHFDENYRRWRDQQIARLDQEYEDYCRERQHRFESDFNTWRQTRQSQGSEGPSGSFHGESGRAGDTARDESLGSGRSAILGGGESAGETTSGGGGDASAMDSSTGSSPEREDLGGRS